MERFQKNMQISMIYENFCPLQGFYKGLAAARNQNKLSIANNKPLNHHGSKFEGSIGGGGSRLTTAATSHIDTNAANYF